MDGYVILVSKVLACMAFVLLALAVPYARRKRGYWTGRGVWAASGPRALVTTLPGVRLDGGPGLARHYGRGAAAGAVVLGLHDGGRPCALACDVRAAAAVTANDGFADADDYGRRPSLVPSAVDAQVMVAVLPAMAECVAELTTSLEAVANRRLTVAPWAEVRKCAAAVVATCVYGQPMVHSRMEAFRGQCDRALSGSRRDGRRPAATDYFAAYDLSSDHRPPPSVDFKRLLMEAAAARTGGGTDTDVADKQVRLDMFEFVTGAIEPTATLVTAVLYELACNRNIQDRLRKHLDSELDEHQQQITIDQLDRLSYLENVIRETLRKYPLTNVMRRVTTKPYIISDGGHNITLEPGTLIAVPVYAIHRDSRYFDAPETFRPHRFPGQLSSAYMPHGTGPQSYIGKHFVGLEAKLIIAMLVSKYEVHIDKTNPNWSPDPFNPTSFSSLRLMVTNLSGVGEAVIVESLRKIEKYNKKFLFF